MQRKEMLPCLHREHRQHGTTGKSWLVSRAEEPDSTLFSSSSFNLHRNNHVPTHKAYPKKSVVCVPPAAKWLSKLE